MFHFQKDINHIDTKVILIFSSLIMDEGLKVLALNEKICKKDISNEKLPTYA
jgi:hypothetical protein